MSSLKEKQSQKKYIDYLKNYSKYSIKWSRHYNVILGGCEIINKREQKNKENSVKQICIHLFHGSWQKSLAF